MKNLLLGLLVSLFLLTGMNIVGAEDPEVLRWALIPAGEEGLERQLFEPLREYLEKKLGMPVKMTICYDYSAVIQAMKFGHADLARSGGFGYLFALSQTEVEPLIREVKKSTGRDYYYGLIMAQRYSDIQTLEDLKGKSFAFVDPGSTSGHLVPRTILLKVGIDPDRDLGRTFYTHSHQASILALRNKKVDAIAIADNRLLDAIENGVITESELVVIHRSKPICGALMFVRKGLSQKLKETIRKVFLEMPRDLTITSGVKCLGYVVAKDEDYDPIREMAEVLQLDLSKKK